MNAKWNCWYVINVTCHWFISKLVTVEPLLKIISHHIKRALCSKNKIYKVISAHFRYVNANFMSSYHEQVNLPQLRVTFHYPIAVTSVFLFMYIIPRLFTSTTVWIEFTPWVQKCIAAHLVIVQIKKTSPRVCKLYCLQNYSELQRQLRELYRCNFQLKQTRRCFRMEGFVDFIRENFSSQNNSISIKLPGNSEFNIVYQTIYFNMLSISKKYHSRLHLYSDPRPLIQ